jgi:hypothetical protein
MKGGRTMESAEKKGMNRRTFIKAGMMGTATALIAPPAFAETLQQMAASEIPVFPNRSIVPWGVPVLRFPW